MEINEKDGLNPNVKTSIERNKTVPLSTLVLCIHPTYRVGETYESEFDLPPDIYFAKSREAANMVLSSYIPQKDSEVLVVMPARGLESGIRSQFREAEKQKQPHWLGMTLEARGKAISRKNVMLIPSFVYGVWSDTDEKEKAERKTRVRDTLLTNLKNHNFSVDLNTRIILCGEFREICVEDTLRQLMLLPEINEILIDKQATLSSEYSTKCYNSTAEMEEAERRADKELIRRLSNKFEVAETERYLVVKKR